MDDVEFLDWLDRLSPMAIEFPAEVLERHRRDLLAHGAVIDGRQVSLQPPLERLSAVRVRKGLDANGSRWIRSLTLDRVHASTNTTMVERARTADVEGDVLTTELQSAGRGRRGRRWTSLYACNLAVSLGSTFNDIPAADGFSLVAGIAVVMALQDVGAHGALLKWPNDVWWRDRKLCGILTEAVPSGGKLQVIAGIGLNVRLPEAARARIDQPVADAADLAGAPVSRNTLLAALVNRYAACTERFRETGLGPFVDAWHELDALAGRPVAALGAQSLEGIARGINSAGELLIERAGQLIAIRSGEVSVRPRRG